ncbi:T6SS immunity protein Tdi1 domain-containing protein [Trinickia sp. YCB016]
MEATFPAFKGRAHCFALDWLGRVFALDSQRRAGDGLGVVMFEPGSGQALEIPCNLSSFHDEELCEYSDAALADDFYRRWLQAGGARPSFNQCVGYKRPLFLGGGDTLENLELVDIDVYWTISGRLISKLNGVPIGTEVKLSGGTAK